jgi:hypothetical protein
MSSGEGGIGNGIFLDLATGFVAGETVPAPRVRPTLTENCLSKIARADAKEAVD